MDHKTYSLVDEYTINMWRGGTVDDFILSDGDLDDGLHDLKYFI